MARNEKSVANTERVAAIIDDPDAVGTRDEVLDELKTLATPEAVMDDTAFGAVPMRQAWSNTLWGSDSTIKTWAKWMCDDGSQAGSLWTWAGESRPGEPFELIGVNLDDFDDEVRGTYSLVDWPYDRAYVRESFASGNTTSDQHRIPARIGTFERMASGFLVLEWWQCILRWDGSSGGDLQSGLAAGCALQRRSNRQRRAFGAASQTAAPIGTPGRW